MENPPILFGKDTTTGAISQIKAIGNVLLTTNGSLNDLTDVVITSATTNQSLLYNGTNWVNSSISQKDYIVINMHGTTANTVYTTNTLKQIMAGIVANYSGTLPNPATNTLGNMSSRTTPLASVFETSTGFITINASKQYIVSTTINQGGVNLNSGTQTELAIYNVVAGVPTVFSPNIINVGRIDLDFAGMGITTTAFVSSASKIVIMFRYVTAQSVAVNPIDTNISVSIMEV